MIALLVIIMLMAGLVLIASRVGRLARERQLFDSLERQFAPHDS